MAKAVKKAARKAPASKRAGAKKAAGKKATKKAATKKAAAKKSPAKKAAGKKSAAKKAPARKTAAKKSPAKKSASKKTAGKKSAVKKAPAKKAAAKKSSARKTAAKKSAARKPATKSSARKAPAKKTAARKSSAKKTNPRAAMPDNGQQAAAPAPRPARKPPRPARARIEKRDGTPVARKVTIRTAVSKPTSPRKQGNEPPAEAEADVDVAADAGTSDESPAMSDRAFVEAIAATVAAMQAMMEGAGDDTEREAITRVEDLWKALKEPAVLSSGEELTPDSFAQLIDEANAAPEISRWLKELPGAENVETFLNDRPPVSEED